MLIACLIPAIIFGIVAIIAFFWRYDDYKWYLSHYYRLDYGAPIRMQWWTWKRLYHVDEEQWRLFLYEGEPRYVWRNPENGRSYEIAFPSYLEFLLAVSFVRRKTRRETRISDRIDVKRELELINEMRTSLAKRAEREQKSMQAKLYALALHEY